MRPEPWRGAPVVAALVLAGLTAHAAAQPLAPGCAEEARLRSLNGDRATELTVVNAGKAERLMFWLDYEGRRVLYRRIAPGMSLTQPTFASHPWVIADGDGRCRRIVVSSPEAMRVEID